MKESNELTQKSLKKMNVEAMLFDGCGKTNCITVIRK
jgi:hypothetical protein